LIFQIAAEAFFDPPETARPDLQPTVEDIDEEVDWSPYPEHHAVPRSFPMEIIV